MLRHFQPLPCNCWWLPLLHFPVWDTLKCNVILKYPFREFSLAYLLNDIIVLHIFSIEFYVWDAVSNFNHLVCIINMCLCTDPSDGPHCPAVINTKLSTFLTPNWMYHPFCTLIYRRRSLYSFFLEPTVCIIYMCLCTDPSDDPHCLVINTKLSTFLTPNWIYHPFHCLYGVLTPAFCLEPCQFERCTWIHLMQQAVVYRCISSPSAVGKQTSTYILWGFQYLVIWHSRVVLSVLQWNVFPMAQSIIRQHIG